MPGLQDSTSSLKEACRQNPSATTGGGNFATNIISSHHVKSTQRRHCLVATCPVRRSLRLTPTEFRTATRLFCGVKPRALPNQPCICTQDLTLTHALSCRRLRARFTRHDALVTDIHEWLRRRRIHTRKEEYVSDTGQDRIDIWVRVDGVVRWCDVTVTDPSGRSIVAKAAVEAGAAARRAEGQKHSAW